MKLFVKFPSLLGLSAKIKVTYTPHEIFPHNKSILISLNVVLSCRFHIKIHFLILPVGRGSGPLVYALNIVNICQIIVVIEILLLLK